MSTTLILDRIQNQLTASAPFPLKSLDDTDGFRAGCRLKVQCVIFEDFEEQQYQVVALQIAAFFLFASLS